MILAWSSPFQQAGPYLQKSYGPLKFTCRVKNRQTDILLTEKKSHYRLICHRNEKDICTCIYKIVSLLKSYDNIHGMTYTAKIMLSGIAKKQSR